MPPVQAPPAPPIEVEQGRIVLVDPTFNETIVRGVPSSLDRPIPGTKLREAPETDRVRILTWNTWGIPEVENERARIQAERVRDHADGFDIILLNEVFDVDAQAAFVTALGPHFPHVIRWAGGAVASDLDDSGLMVFSKFPFGKANLNRNSLPGDVGNVDCYVNGRYMADPSAYVRFLEFDESDGLDEWSAKGALLFHVDPPGGRLNIVATHMDSGLDPGDIQARKEQLDFIRTLMSDRIPDDDPSQTIVAGDINIDGYMARERGGSAEVPENDRRLDEYRARIWGTLGEGHARPPFFDAWRTTSPRDEGITNNLGEQDGEDYVGNFRYDYFLLSGEGYHRANQQTWSPPFPYPASRRFPRCVNWVRTTLSTVTSDHIGVAMELGPKSPACNPAMAEDLSLGLVGDDIATHSPANTLGVPFVRRLAKAGANRWFRVPKGTYTIGFAEKEHAAGMRLEIFSPKSLSRGFEPLPLGRSKLIDVAPELCRELTPCRYVTNRFHGGDDEMYLRVFSENARLFGDFHLFVLKHDCLSEATACALKPAVPYSPDLPSSISDDGFFTFSTVPTANPRVPQTLEFRIAVRDPALGKVRVRLFRGSIPAGATVATPITAGAIVAQEAEATTYLLRVARTTGSGRYTVVATTDATVVSGGREDVPKAKQGGPIVMPTPVGMKLTMINEGGVGFLGDEEISVRVTADGNSIGPVLFRPDLDYDEVFDLADIPNFAFVREANMLIREHDGETLSDRVEDTAIYSRDEPDGAFAQDLAVLYEYPFGTNGIQGGVGPTVQIQYFISHGVLP